MASKGGLFVGNITQGLSRPRDWQDDGGARAPEQQQASSDVGDNAAVDRHLFDQQVFRTSPVPVLHHRFPKTIA